MADTKRNYDSNLAEEASATGQRVTGAVKEGVGAVTGNRDLERRGEMENAAGNTRQAANHVFGSFNDRESAERAYNAATSRGYKQDDVNLLMSNDTRDKYFSSDSEDTELSSKAADGAGTGAMIGGTAVGVLGAIAAIGTSVAIPGLGLLLAGPLVAGLVGMGAGGLTGGLIGALIGWGIPEDRAKAYEDDVRNGRIVMGVNPRTPEDATYFEKEWTKNQAHNITR